MGLGEIDAASSQPRSSLIARCVDCLFLKSPAMKCIFVAKHMSHNDVTDQFQGQFSFFFLVMLLICSRSLNNISVTFWRQTLVGDSQSQCGESPDLEERK